MKYMNDTKRSEQKYTKQKQCTQDNKWMNLESFFEKCERKREGEKVFF